MSVTVCQSAMDNLRKCADLLQSAAAEIQTDKMDIDELGEAMDTARDVEFEVSSLIDKLDSAQWSRPAYWRQFFRNDKPLYDAAQVVDSLGEMRIVSGKLPAPWTGYLFALKADKQNSYVMRVFDSYTRDVVPAEEAHTAPSRVRETIFDDRSIIEKPAQALEMTVFEYGTMQTSEPKHEIVALCFV